MTKTESVLAGTRPFWVSAGSCLSHMATMPDESIDCVVTSPPYFGLRDYGTNSDEEIGKEETPEEFIASLVKVFDEVRRVMKPTGACFVNLGDSYFGGGGYSPNAPSNQGKGSISSHQSSAQVGATTGGKKSFSGYKGKDLIGIPWMFALAARAAGWYLRQEVIWEKPNPLPESVRDRCVRSTESVFLLTKSARYHWNQRAAKEPAVYAGQRRGKSNQRYNYQQNADSLAGVMDERTIRNVWQFQPANGIKWGKGVRHPAAFPEGLVAKCLSLIAPPAGRRCDCEELIATPTGTGDIDDPSVVKGRAGFLRPRRDGGGTAAITKRQQRWEADQLRALPNRGELKRRCGEALAHYLRKDGSGARPLPPELRKEFLRRGWLTPAPACGCPPMPAGVVYDPFTGSGTTGRVAVRRGLRFVGSELNPEYAALARKRIVAALSSRGFGLA